MTTCENIDQCVDETDDCDDVAEVCIDTSGCTTVTVTVTVLTDMSCSIDKRAADTGDTNTAGNRTGSALTYDGNDGCNDFRFD